MRGTTIDRRSVGCCTISDGVDLEVRPGNRMHVTGGDGAAGGCAVSWPIRNCSIRNGATPAPPRPAPSPLTLNIPRGL